MPRGKRRTIVAEVPCGKPEQVNERLDGLSRALVDIERASELLESAKSAAIDRMPRLSRCRLASAISSLKGLESDLEDLPRCEADVGGKCYE